MLRARALTVVVTLMLAAVTLSGCLLPKAYLAKNTQPPIVYDTAWASSSDGVQLASVSDEHATLVDRYGESLAEPAWVVEAVDEDLHCVVHYATNRVDIVRTGREKLKSTNLSEEPSVFSEQEEQFLQEVREELFQQELMLEGRASMTSQVGFATHQERDEYYHQMFQEIEQSGYGALYGSGVEDSPEYGVSTVFLPSRDRYKAVVTKTVSKTVTIGLGRDGFSLEPSETVSKEPLDRRRRGEDPDYVHVRIMKPPGERLFFESLNKTIAESPQQDVLVFVHGFNVSFKEAVVRATQVAMDIPFNGAIVVYSWPSQGGVENYERDGEVIAESVAAFTQFLTDLGQQLPADVEINILAHSMGNRLLTRSLAYLPDSFTDPPRFKEIVFCAPDVEFDAFKRRVPRAVELCERATLYKNANDMALLTSKLKSFTERAGGGFRPVLVEGLDTIEAAPIDKSLMGHSYYGSNTSLLRDLFAILKEHRPVANREWLGKKKMPFVDTPWWIIEEFPRELDWKWHFEAGQSSVDPSSDATSGVQVESPRSGSTRSGQGGSLFHTVEETRGWRGRPAKRKPPNRRLPRTGASFGAPPPPNSLGLRRLNGVQTVEPLSERTPSESDRCVVTTTLQSGATGLPTNDANETNLEEGDFGFTPWPLIPDQRLFVS